MCVTIYANDGDIEIETPRQLEEILGIKAKPSYGYKTVDPEACLCQIDAELELTNAGHEVDFQYGDLYIKNKI